jgi:hypothetical protein
VSYPINLSFKDDEFEQVNKASAKTGKKIRDYIKEASIEKSKKDLGKGDA